MTLRKNVIAIFFVACLTSQSDVTAQGTTEVIAETGFQPGVLNEPITTLGIPLINNSGRVFINAGTATGGYSLEYDMGEYALVPRPAAFANGDWRVFAYAEDHIAIHNGSFNDATNFIWSRASSSWTEFFPNGSAAPDGDGTIVRPFYPHMSQSGQWLTALLFEGTSNGSLDNHALAITNGTGTPFQFVTEGDQAPNGNTYNTLSPESIYPEDYAINENGQVAFAGELESSPQTNGLFMWDGSSVQEIVREGDPVSTGGTFYLDQHGNFGLTALRMGLDDTGNVSFHAKVLEGNELRSAMFHWDGQEISEEFSLPFTITVDGTDYELTRFDSSIRPNSAGEQAFALDAPGFGNAVVLLKPNEHQVLFQTHDDVGDGRLIGGVVRRGEFDPAETFNDDEPWLDINKHGVVCTKMYLQGQNLGDIGIFMSDGIDRIEVASTGFEIRPGRFLRTPEFSYFDLQGARFFNDFGQVVYSDIDDTFKYVNCLFTPDLAWRTGQSGLWDTRENWTLGLPPAQVHHILIDGANVIVTGPVADTTVRSLTVGGTPDFRSELQLQSGVTLSVSEGCQVSDGSALSGNGILDGDVDLFGELSPGLSPGEITITADLSMGPQAASIFEVEGTQPNRYDRLIVGGNVQLDGELQVVFGSREFLAAGQQYLLGDVAGTVSGQFANAAEGTVVHSQGNLQVSLSYVLSDGNDVGLVVTSVDAVQPFGRKLLDGDEVGGQLSDTTDSDDVYYELDPPPTSNPVKQIVEIILLGETTISNPASISFRLEAAMNGGPSGDVIQTIEFWNETDQQWEVLDTRSATNADSTVHVTPTGDLTRFIHPLTDEIIARVKWVSPDFSGAAFDWSIDIDQFGWLIGS